MILYRETCSFPKQSYKKTTSHFQELQQVKKACHSGKQ